MGAEESAAGGIVGFATDGTIKFQPLAGWQGKDSVQYTVSDKDGSTDTALVHFDVLVA